MLMPSLYCGLHQDLEAIFVDCSYFLFRVHHCYFAWWSCSSTMQIILRRRLVPWGCKCFSCWQHEQQIGMPLISLINIQFSYSCITLYSLALHSSCSTSHCPIVCVDVLTIQYVFIWPLLSLWLDLLGLWGVDSQSAQLNAYRRRGERRSMFLADQSITWNGFCPTGVAFVSTTSWKMQQHKPLEFACN